MRSAGWRKLILPFGSLAVVALLATLAVGCQQNPGSPIPAASTPPAQTTSAVASSQSGKATFKIKSLDVAPSEVTAGQSSTATVVVENIGAIDGTFAIALRVNGTVLDTKEVTLTPGSTKSATFAINRDSAGTYEVKVEDVVATLVVKQVVLPTQTPAIQVATASAYDYFPTKPGYSVLYSMSDEYGSNRLDNAQVEVVFQNTKQGTFFTTLTQVGTTGGAYRNSAILGKEFDKRLVYYGGVPVSNQANFWYRLVSLPISFQDGDTWQHGTARYKLISVDDRRIGSILYKECVKITIDNTADTLSFVNGRGEFYLSRGIGIIDYVFTRSDGKKFTATIGESKQQLPKTISGILTTYGQTPATYHSVGLANSLQEGINSTIVDSQGRFSLQMFGRAIVLRYGPPMNADQLEIAQAKERKIDNITGDMADVQLSMTN
jgi:hypothetical protein